MRRVLHNELMRGHKAQRAAIILLTGLLLVPDSGVGFIGVDSLLSGLRAHREGPECLTARSLRPAEGLLQFHPHIVKSPHPRGSR